MKRLSFFLKIYVLCCFFIAANALQAQTVEYLDVNNVRAGIAIGGNLFSKTDSLTGSTNVNLFQVPNGSPKSLIFTQAFWFSALDSRDSLHVAANRYFDYGQDFFDGPVAAFYYGIYDNYYKRVFKVTQVQISAFRNLTFPVNETQVDSAILFWPGAGNPSVQADYGVNISSRLAPFVDVNNNGIYEPLLGDYPGICGDEGIFFVFNDERSPHTQTGGKALGIEIRGLANAYNVTSPLPYQKQALNNSIFVQYEIENKSQNNYTDFNIGNWLDPDIGCFNNDYVGCDTNRNLMFAYNGTAVDPDCLPEYGYDSMPVVLGVKLLNDPLNIFGYFSGQGAPSPANSDPVTPNQYNLFLHGYWNDTTNFEFGGNGWHTSDAATKYIFSGDPTDTIQWSEVTARNNPGDRRMFGTSHVNTFNAGAVKHIDYAYFGSYDSTSNHISIVDTLKRDADILQAFYNNHIVACQSQFTTSISNVAATTTISIYPNPASNQITISSSDYIKSIELMDIQGRVLNNITAGAKTITLPVSNLAKGIYLVNIQCNGGNVVRRVVVE